MTTWTNSEKSEKKLGDGTIDTSKCTGTAVKKNNLLMSLKKKISAKVCWNWPE